MSATTDITAVDLDRLLEQSRPRPGFGGGWFLLVAVAMILLILVPGGSAWVEPLIPVFFAVLVLLSLVHTSRLARAQKIEGDQLRMADESLRLGAYDRASGHLNQLLLAKPSRRPQIRIQGLIYLAGLLNRIGRYSDVIRLCDYLESEAQFPPGVTLSLRCMRVYAMLRDDRISDSYSAIGDLKRDFPAGSGMLSVLEMYRLVKTGHHDDALVMFEQRRTQLAEQLAHRSCDAWALAAAGALALGKQEQAATYARNAALLSNRQEIMARFPETAAALNLQSGEAAQS